MKPQEGERERDQDEQQQEEREEEQQYEQALHPVIADLCYHLSRTPSLASSSRNEGDAAQDHRPSSDAGADADAKNAAPRSKRPGLPLPVAAIRVLLDVIRRSRAETMMGLQADLRDASDVMIAFAKRGGPVPIAATTSAAPSTKYLLANRSHIALSSSCELFLNHVTRSSSHLETATPHFQSQLLERGTRFVEFSLSSRDRISSVASPFVREGTTVLTHGRSKVVEAVLLRAARVEKKRFNVIVLEGRPDAGGAKTAKAYDEAGIPTAVVLDAAMGYVMEKVKVDMVLVGAEGVVENGGVVNKMGTFALGVLAKELGVPFYVAAESYKFTRLYPLNNADLPEMGKLDGGGLAFLDTLSWSVNSSSGSKGGQGKEEKKTEAGEDGSLNACADLSSYVVNLSPSVSVGNPPCDFTPAKYITLLFTDLGVLTPSAVSDELIRLYQ
ncbi:hypothetical protein ACHAXS_008701 [Conticribra weissflogii]